jgi:ABC-type multidrug transport system fused ATPase/permease subunit
VYDVFRKVDDLLEPGDRFRALLLLAMILVSGMLETAGVASILPFVAVLTNPSVVKTNSYLAGAYDWFGFATVHSFLFFLGLGVLVTIIASTAFRALTTWAMLRFTFMRSYTLSLRLFERYLHRPYDWFLGQHSARLGKTILSEVGYVINGALVPAMQLVAQGVTALFILTLLLVVDLWLALIASAVLGGAYWLIFWMSRHYLQRLGKDRVQANRERFRLSGEAFGAIKEIKLLGLEAVFLQRFAKQSRLFLRRELSSDMLSQLPYYALYAIAFTGIMLVLQYQLLFGGSIERVLPLIALYVLAGTRLLPALQRIYKNGTKLQFVKPALDNLHRDLIEGAVVLQESNKTPPSVPNRFCLSDRLELRHVRYSYPGASVPALDDVTLTVPARTSVGLVGRTGTGKTTLVDVILGLLDPDDGQLLVNGTLITKANKRDWQQSVGYVPQHIFLVDDSVAANIAFGVPPSEIDRTAVETAARIANLHDFVVRGLERGYDTRIGERGVRLSGGERQRVGIARALYRNPILLIMDEATSALDNITERAVMDAVANMSGQLTMILIAHRLTTVRQCDTILLLEHGRIIARGSYDSLLASSEHFREMVERGDHGRYSSLCGA